MGSQPTSRFDSVLLYSFPVSSVGRAAQRVKDAIGNDCFLRWLVAGSSPALVFLFGCVAQWKSVVDFFIYVKCHASIDSDAHALSAWEAGANPERGSNVLSTS